MDFLLRAMHGRGGSFMKKIDFMRGVVILLEIVGQLKSEEV